jgi:hypothetical protein
MKVERTKIDREKLKLLATWMINNLKSLEFDIQCYELALMAFRVGFPKESVAFDLALARAKVHQPTVEAMYQKYDAPLAQLLERISQDEEHESAFLAFLQSWEPNKDPVN